MWDEHSLKFQPSGSSGLGLTVFGRYFHKPLLSQLVTLINDEAVYRTAPATPGLLKTYSKIYLLVIDRSTHTTRAVKIQGVTD